MSKSILELAFKHEGLDCVIMLVSWGHRCGYVGVKKDSPLFKVNYSDDLKKPELLKELKQTTVGKRGVIPFICWDGEKTTPEMLFNVHGGITYSNGLSCWPVTRGYPLWWFGFDCAHCDDAKDWESIKKVFPEKVWRASYDINVKYGYRSGGVVRTKDYVEQECRNLAEQIRCVESTY